MIIRFNKTIYRIYTAPKQIKGGGVIQYAVFSAYCCATLFSIRSLLGPFMM